MTGTRSRGRPTKITEELVKTITEYIKAGNYPEVAASLAGVSRATFYNWLKKGHEHKTGIHHDFLDSIKEAEDYAEAAGVERIRKAGEKNWTALAWWLERKHPERWGRRSDLKLEHSGGVTQNHGGVVDVQHKLRIPDDPDIRRKARDVIKSIRTSQMESGESGDGGE